MKPTKAIAKGAKKTIVRVTAKKKSVPAKTSAVRDSLVGDVTADYLYKKYVLEPRVDFTTAGIPGAILYATEAAKRGERKVVLIGPEDIGLDIAAEKLADRLKVRSYILKRNADDAAHKRWADKLDAAEGFVAVCHLRRHAAVDACRGAKTYSIDLQRDDHRKAVHQSMELFAEHLLRAENIPFIRGEVQNMIGPVLPSLTAVLTILASYITRKRQEAADSNVSAKTRDDAASADDGSPPAEVAKPTRNSNETGELLSLISETFDRHAVLQKGYSSILALVALHFWAFEAAQTSPIPVLQSFVPECGKSTVLELITKLSPRPKPTFGLTGPTLFELADAGHTLLFDEGDMFLSNKNDLIALFNVGFKRNGPLIRRAGGKEYRAWCPKVIAKIGKIEPEALATRCIVFRMHRKLAEEICEPLRNKHDVELKAHAQRCEAWAREAVERLRGAEPQMPPGFTSRRADKWEPILAIAEDAGQEWTQHVHAVAQAIEAIDKEEPSIQELLIIDIKRIFDITGLDAMGSAGLVGFLKQMAERPWSEWGSNGQRRLAELLRMEHGIHVKNVRTPLQTKGYERAQFKELFKRYGQKPDQWWDGW